MGVMKAAKACSGMVRVLTKSKVGKRNGRGAAALSSRSPMAVRYDDPSRIRVASRALICNLFQICNTIPLSDETEDCKSSEGLCCEHAGCSSHVETGWTVTLDCLCRIRIKVAPRFLHARFFWPIFLVTM